MEERIKKQLEFSLEIDKEKNVFRQTSLSGKGRKEIDAGDTYAYDEEGLKTQKERENAAKERIFSILPDDQKQELTALFDEFESGQTAESRFAHAMDNLQPLMLNDSNDGADWREHNTSAKAVYGRHAMTKLGSETIYAITEQIIKKHIERGNLI